MELKIILTIVGLTMGILTLIKDNFKKKWIFNLLIIICMVFIAISAIIDIVDNEVSKNKVSFHYEKYQNKNYLNPGLYIDNKGLERFFIDSIKINYKDKIIMIFDDSSWVHAIKSLEVSSVVSG